MYGINAQIKSRTPTKIIDYTHEDISQTLKSIKQMGIKVHVFI